MTKTLQTLSFALIAFLSFAPVALAQTETPEVTGAPATQEEMEEFGIEGGMMLEEDIDVTSPEDTSEEVMEEEVVPELTVEEVVEMIEQAEEITADDLEDGTIIAGEVILVTDEYIVVGDSEGTLVKVENSSRSRAQRLRTRTIVSSNNIERGNIVTFFPSSAQIVSGTDATFSSDSVTLSRNGESTSYTLPQSVPVIFNGETVSLDSITDVSEDTLVTLILDEDTDEVLGVTLLDSTGETSGEKSSRSRTVIIIVVVILAALIVSTLVRNRS